MNLFEDIESPKDGSAIEGIEKQVCTQLLYFSLEEREEFKKLMKKCVKDLLGDEEASKQNISDGVLTLLRKHYE